MPPPTHHSLVHVLLLWISVLSIIQVAFITVYLIAGHHSAHQNNSVTASEPMTGNNIRNLPISVKQELPLGPGKMLSFQASDRAGHSHAPTRIQWVSNIPDTWPAFLSGREELVINKDGYYFLNLQVTLRDSDPCGQKHTVSLVADKSVILQGRTNAESCSTGVLSKAETLRAGQKLVVTVHPGAIINTTNSQTHLDIIYIFKP